MRYARAMTTYAVIGFVLLTNAGARAAAQQPARCKVLCSPVLVFQPTLVVSNAINGPTVDSAGRSAGRGNDFLFRLTTAVPTQAPRVALVGIVQWTPFATEKRTTGGRSAQIRKNSPSFLYGPAVTLVKRERLALNVSVYGAYRPWGKPDREGDVNAYKHQLLLAAGGDARIGTLLAASAPPIVRAVSAYAMVLQQITGRPQGVDGRRPYSPSVLLGFKVPVAPFP